MSFINYFDFNFSSLNSIVLAQFVVAVALVGLGVIVFEHNRSSWVNRSFLVVTILVGAWLAAILLGSLAKTEKQAVFWFKIVYLNVINISLATYAFSVFYTRSIKQRPLIGIGLVISLIWIFLLLGDYPGFINGVHTYEWGYYPKAGKYFWLFLGYFFIYVFLLNLNLVGFYLRSKIRLERQVSLFIIIAFILAYIGASDFLPSLGVPILPIRPLGFIPIAIWVGLMGYTILQYRVWDVTFVAHRTAYYFVFSIIILYVYAFFFWIFLRLIHGTIDIKNLIFNSALFLALTFFLGSLKERTHQFIDRVFYRQRIHYKTLIEELNKELTVLVDVDTLVNKVVTVLGKDLLVKYITLLVHKDARVRYFEPLKTTVSKSAGTQLLFETEKQFFDAIAEAQTVSIDELHSYPRYASVKGRGNRIFRMYKAELCIPLVRRGSLIGMLFLGRRQHKKGYDPDVRQYFAEFARVLAVSLENAELFQEVKTVSQLKSDIIMIVSHQLRTPITGIRWLAKLLLDGDAGALTEEQHDLVEQMYKRNLDTISIVNRLLDLSRLERGVLAFEPKVFDFIPFIEVLVQKMRHLADKKEITIQVVTPFKSLSISGDEERLRDVFEIIIDNAIKYSPLVSKVIVMVQKSSFGEGKEAGEALKVSIQDYGIGIAASDERHLFSKFFRGKNAVKLETSGLGIGLAYAKSLIDFHKGHIELRSKLGAGTQVDVYVPMGREGD